MKAMQYVYGPVPSRRLGISLGISPIPKKTCNYSCIYCQLGRTNHLANKRQMFFAVKDIVMEFEEVIKANSNFDVVTIVGEGEPTLYLGLGEMIDEIKSRTDKPIAVITNGALLSDRQVQFELSKAHIILPSMDAFDEKSLRAINRPHGEISFAQVYEGLRAFSLTFEGQIWIEIMLMKDYNADDLSLARYAELLKTIKFDRLYLNTPVRPPAESYVEPVTHDTMNHAVDILGGISIDLLDSEGFHSEISDHYEAIMSIIKRHPMNQFEIKNFLGTRDCKDIPLIFEQLEVDDSVEAVSYKGYATYRLK